MPDSIYTDDELRDWLGFQQEHGSNFLKAVAEAALIADIRDYNLMRPLLLELKKEWRRSA
jgi:hypothetical protein